MIVNTKRQFMHSKNIQIHRGLTKGVKFSKALNPKFDLQIRVDTYKFKK